MKINEKIGYISHNNMAKGCKQCIQGKKLVLFITGLCGQRCSYCPVSEQKFGNDETYANEWKIKDKEDLLEEVRLTDAKGAGITGGDPLAAIDKTCEYIEYLKQKLGKRFHIHLYTPLQLVNRERLKKLYDAGLDEIRFHPDIHDNSKWGRILLANKYDWDVGVEIPVLPNEEENIIKLLEFIKGEVKFINLNELEFSDTTIKHYNLQDYKLKDSVSYAAKDSKETAVKVIKYAKNKKIPLTVFFCSAKLKDKTQMGNRIKRRAKEVAKDYDVITKEGMLIRGVIYLKEFVPGFGYHKKIDEHEHGSFVKELMEAKKLILKKTTIKKIDVDDHKLRLTLSAKSLQLFSRKIKRLGFKPAIVEEYPTVDSIEVEIHML